MRPLPSLSTTLTAGVAVLLLVGGSQALSPDYIQNDTYSPSFYVETGAALTPQDFDLSSGFGIEVGITAGCMLIAGIASLLLFALGICLRCCVPCLRCRPQRPPRESETDSAELEPESEREQQQPQPQPQPQQARVQDEEQGEDGDRDKDSESESESDADEQASYPWNAQRVRTFALFFLFCALSLGADALIPASRPSITQGARTVRDSVLSLFDMVHNITVSAHTIQDYSFELEAELTAAKSSCPQLQFLPSNIDQSVQDFQDNAAAVVDTLDPLDVDPQSIVDLFENYFASAALLFVPFGLVLLAVGLLVLFAVYAKRDGMRASVGLGSCAYILLLLVSAVSMVLVMIMGDFCVSPSYNAVSLVPEGDAQDTAVYYTACNANSTSSFNADLQESFQYVEDFMRQINFATSTICVNDPNLYAMRDTVIAVNDTLNQVLAQTECEHIKSMWTASVNEGLCTQTYEGIFWLWGSTLLTSFFLFLTLVLATMVYQFFLPWEELPASDSDESVRNMRPELLNSKDSARQAQRLSRALDVDAGQVELVEAGGVTILDADSDRSRSRSSRRSYRYVQTEGEEEADPRYSNPRLSANHIDPYDDLMHDKFLRYERQN